MGNRGKVSLKSIKYMVQCTFCRVNRGISITLHFLEEISYIAILEDWEIAPSKLKLLDKKLGGGKFGIVRKGLLTSERVSPEAVAVKTLKGAKKHPKFRYFVNCNVL